VRCDGDAIAQVQTAYPKRAKVTPNRYRRHADGKYTTVKSANGKSAIWFEIDKRRLINYYAGRFPAGEYVERCL
jgi:hypothetical protein